MPRSTLAIDREIRRLIDGLGLTARGLWHEMRRLIDESDRQGHLQLNGRPMADEQLARRAGCSSTKIAPLLQKLVDAGLIEKADCCWHSPHLARIAQLNGSGARRVRLHRERRAHATAGGAAAVESALTALRNAPRNAGSNADVTTNPDPLASFSPTPPLPTHPSPQESPGANADEAVTRPTRRRRIDEPMPEIPDILNTPEFRDAWTAWLHYRAGTHAVTPRAAVIQLCDCAGWGVEVAIRQIKTSISCGYRGIFEPSVSRGAKHNGKHPERRTGTERGQYAEPDVPTLTLAGSSAAKRSAG
jgi:hypothetical protein